MVKFAANLSMMFNEVDFLDRFDAAQMAGFSGVEFLFPYDYEASQIRAKLEGAALTQALFNLPPGDWEKGERGFAALPGREAEFDAALDTALAYAEVIGNDLLHVMSGITPFTDSRETCADTLIENLKRAAPKAAAKGKTLVIEPINTRDIPGYFLNRQEQARTIIEKVGADNVGLQFDFYHCQIVQGDLAQTFEAHADIVRHVQIAGVPDRHEPDIGEVNYPYLFELLERFGYDGWVGCEYRPRANTVDGLSWMKGLI